MNLLKHTEISKEKNAVFTQANMTNKRWEIISYSEKYKDQINQLILGVLNGEFGMDYVLTDLDEIQEIYHKNNGNFWIALKNGKVIGSIALRNFGKNRGMLKRMFVDKNFRGKGLAAALLTKLLEFAKTRQYKVIYLTTLDEMIAAMKFYEKSGFKKISKLPSDIPDFGDHIFYEIEI